MDVKRVLSVILVVVMCCAWASAVGTDAERKDLAEQLKKLACDVLVDLHGKYEKNPEAFSDEYILMAHAYYEMYKAETAVIQAERQLSLALNPLSGGKSPMMDVVKENEKLSQSVDEFETAQWYKWVNGEASNAEYLKVFMAMVGAVVAQADK